MVEPMRGDRVGKTKRGKGTKLMVLADADGLPLSIEIASASEAEVNLIEPLLDSAATTYVPNKLAARIPSSRRPVRILLIHLPRLR